MDVLGSASQVLLNLSLTQKREQTDIRALASGLRVNSAVNDPSGYGIAQRLQTQVNGFQQAVQNVQTANNALAVANGALTTITLILQRIRSLVVQSRSDLNSATDLSNIQAEISQLLLEVNHISSSTSFNGIDLLNGQFQTTAPTSPLANSAGYGAVQVPSPILNPNGSTPGSTVVNADGLGNPGPLVTLQGPGVPPPSTYVPNFITFTVTGYSANAIDPDSGTAVGPGVYVQVQAYSANPALGAAPLYVDTSAVAVNSGPLGPTFIPNPGSYSGGGSFLDLLDFTLANLTQQDVGSSISFEVLNPPVSAPPNAGPLYVQNGPQEGQTTAISLPGVSTAALNISDISILAPQTVNYQNIVQGQSSSNNIPAADAEMRVDAALSQITQAQAQIGAQMVALNYDANNANTASVNLTASVSSIQDANIGATVTDLTQQQILTHIGTSVIAQMQVSALQITALMLNGIGIGVGAGAAPIA
ncbi:MAG: flagellin [Candidatus Eremiobacteraeota bacterium]|nr:flagellin [Candidatus Eremiobacteraeota bacterium]